jgi:hypothetical protein
MRKQSRNASDADAASDLQSGGKVFAWFRHSPRKPAQIPCRLTIDLMNG